MRRCPESASSSSLAKDMAEEFMNRAAQRRKHIRQCKELGLDDRSERHGWYDIKNSWGETNAVADSGFRHLDSWSEFCDHFSLEAYFPILDKYAEQQQIRPILEFFEGVKTLMTLNRAMYCLRTDWHPLPMMQEYRTSELQDYVSKLVRAEFKKQKKDA